MGWTPPDLDTASSCQLSSYGVSVSANQEESERDATTVAVDLAKNVFQLAVADGHWRIVERHRLTRSQFERWFHNRAVAQVVMEACGSAHFWARGLQNQGIAVTLLPPR